MKVYSSCFIGVALPQKYQEEFEKLLIDIKTIDANIETAQSQTPHITVCYLNKQSQFSLNEINKLIKSSMPILSKVKLKVGGFDYFTKENPKVLFLDVVYPKSLAEFNIKISGLLMEYSGSNNKLPFHPHMTVGRIKAAQAQESFKLNEKKLKLKFYTINWSFKVNEVTLYGVDSTKSPEHQEKLFTILI